MDEICCDKLERQIIEYALGARSGLSVEEHAAAKAHLSYCSSCREDLQFYKEIDNCFPKSSDIEVPEEVMQRTHDRISAMLKEKMDEHFAADASRKLKFAWSSFIAAAAAVVMLAVGVVWSITGERPGAIIDNSGGPSAKKAVTTQKQHLAATQESGEGFLLIKEMFEKLKTKPEPKNRDFRTIITMCDKLIQHRTDSLDAISARKLISECYAQMAEPEKSHEAFLAYADSLAATAFQKKLAEGVPERVAKSEAALATANVIRKRADHLFAKKDYLAALSYFDVLLARYPGTETAEYAQYMTGRYYEAVKQPREAVSCYRQVIQTGQSESLIRLAYSAASQAYFNMGAKEDGLKVLNEMATHFRNDDDVAYVAFNSGVLQYARGERYYPDALAKFQLVVKRYPAHRYARSAKGMINLMNRRIFDVILDL